MLMYLLQISSAFTLSLQPCRYREYALLCDFNFGQDGFQQFIARAGPRTNKRGVFREFRRLCVKNRFVLAERANTTINSTFIHAYSKRKRKVGVSNRGAVSYTHLTLPTTERV